MKKEIENAISAYAGPVNLGLRSLRRLILETAQETLGVGPIHEDLRWGQASFLTQATGSGSTIRIDGFRNDSKKFAIFFHCQTGLIDQFRTIYGDKLTFDGNRAIELCADKPLPEKELKHCIMLALTHHLRKKSGRSRSGHVRRNSN
jgi:hypothetical protein